MKEYLLSVAGIVLFSSVLLTILPNGKTTELIKGIARLACLVVILAPIGQFLVEGKDFNGIFAESGIELQTSFIEYSSKEKLAEAEKSLLKALQKEYPSTVSVKLVCENEEAESSLLRVEAIYVYVKEWSKTLETELKERLMADYGCKGVICGVA